MFGSPASIPKLNALLILIFRRIQFGYFPPNFHALLFVSLRSIHTLSSFM